MLASAAQAFADAPVPMAVVAVRDGALAEVQLVNRALVDLLNATPQDVVGLPVADLVHPEDAILFSAHIGDLINPMEQLQVRVVRNGWGVVWTALSVAPQGMQGDHDEPELAVIALHDVTLWRRVEEELAHRATHDSLTGLANRSLLLDQLDRSLAKLSRRQGNVAVLFCDLDGFKHLNDTFGHRVGDAVLQEAAGRILNAVRREDLVVRMGGDEFVIVCESTDSSEAGRVAERVRDSLEHPLRVHDRDFTIGLSIGVAQVADNAANPEDLLRRADLAMYRAKQRGRNRVEFFAPELEEQARARAEVVEEVRRALGADDLVIELQPIIELASGSWVGSEALARIKRTGTSTLLPEQFLADSARAGLLERLDARVREKALTWLAGKIAHGSAGPGWVSVNVSVRELTSIRFAGVVEEQLAAVGLRPQQLVIELSESAMVEAVGPTLVTLRRLRAMGCMVAIDDFGSGYSSLMSLRDLPADLVKIDRSFIAGLGSNEHDATIVSAMISIGHRLGRRMVAEGVENPMQSELLQQMGCDYGQGYLFGGPTPPAPAGP